MNQQVINYLKENKDKYSKEVLIKELEKTGYPKKDIAEGVGVVFGGATNNFWDFKSKKVYTQKSEKIADFLFGFLGIIAINIFFRFLPAVFAVVGFVLYVYFLFYFFNRRRYIFYGLISTIIFGIMAAAFLSLMFFLRFRGF